MAKRTTIRGKDRVRYTLGPHGQSFRKDKTFADRDEALKFKKAIEQVEQATRMGVARR